MQKNVRPTRIMRSGCRALRTVSALGAVVLSFYLAPQSYAQAVHLQSATASKEMDGNTFKGLAQRDPTAANQFVLATSKHLIASSKVSHKFVCLPDGITYLNGPDLTTAYLMDHPEQSRYPIEQLIFIAWMTAYPC